MHERVLWCGSRVLVPPSVCESPAARTRLRSQRAKAECQRRVEQIQTLGFLFDQMDRDNNGCLERAELLDPPPLIRDRLGEVLGFGVHVSEEVRGESARGLTRGRYRGTGNILTSALNCSLPLLL